MKLHPENYPDIPVAKQRERILAAIKEHQVIVVVGDTGSGKTTQLPKMALEYVEGLAEGERKLVGCTQPRRIAAASVSKRVAEELQVEHGVEVGYQVRFEDKSNKETRLKFMTDGILLAETQGDADLDKYSVIIIDEAHERSLNIDFLIGYLKRLIARRPDLRVVISSATLDAGAFAEFFQQAPVIEVEGRTFPVETHYLENLDNLYLSQHVIEACQWVRSVDQQGDILVFLAGEREIRECADALEGENWARTEILPLFARLGLAEQQRVFRTLQGTQRIVLATNVAETSLTIPGIVYVVDSGLARVSRWNPSRQVQRLQIENISQASARQRKGRCGRVREGVCVRLYSEEDHDARQEYTDPEIRRSSLAGVILRMKSLRLPNIDVFPFIDPPSSKHIAEGYRTLREIGALDDDHRMLKVGRQLARLPVEPRLGKMLLEAEKGGCLAELLVIVSGLSTMDPRERPQEKQQQADQAHARWNHPQSDFLTILNLWRDIQRLKSGRRFQTNQLRKFCRKQFVNFRRVLEWDNLHRELSQLGKRALRWQVDELSSKQEEWAHNDAIHKAILGGIPKQIGVFDREKKAFKGAQGKDFSIFPASVLFSKKKLDWVLAYEMVDTTKLWARRNAVMNPRWVEEVAPHLCRKRWHSAYFDPQQGAVYAKEVITCANLTLVADRNVHFGRINPEAAREVFIMEALIQGGLTAKPRIIKHLAKLKQQVAEAEQKLRRVDGIWAEQLVIEWFRQRLPLEISTAKAFLQWCKQSQELPELDDCCYESLEDLRLEQYPDSLEHEEEYYPLYYKVAPGEPDDGVTIGIHVDQLTLFPSYLGGWGVQGDLQERVQYLIKSLPKAQRIACNPARETAGEFAELWLGKPREQFLNSALAAFLAKRTGLRIAAADFSEDRIPSSLRVKYWIADDQGHELGFSESLVELQQKLSHLMTERFEEHSSAEWDYSGLSDFDCDPLPILIEKPQGNAYPALIDEGQTVGVKVFANQRQAEQEHRFGVIRLFLLKHFDQVKYISKTLPLAIDTKMYLPLLGEKGVDQTAIIRWVVEHAIGNLPRDKQSFVKASDHARGNLHDAAQEVCAILDNIVSLYRQLDNELAQWRDDTHYGEIAEDIDEQMRWLLRAEFGKQTPFATLRHYPLWFKGMLERMERARNQPLVKDLEKMDDLLEYWSPWFNDWSERREEMDLISLGEQLQHWRTQIFAPSLRLPVKVSQKTIRKMVDAIS